MSVEDPRVSIASEDNAVEHFHSELAEQISLSEDDRRQDMMRIEVAQADTGRAPTGDRVPAASDAAPAPATPAVVEVNPDTSNTVRLAATISIDEIRIEGANLILVQADGSEIVIINGATKVPTILLGDIELPQQSFIAALEGSGINVAAGPDGSYSASAAPGSSGGNFEDSLQQSQNGTIQLADLLGDTGFGDGTAFSLQSTGDDQPTVRGILTQLFGVETTDETGMFENIELNGRLDFDQGNEFGVVVNVSLNGPVYSGGVLVETAFVVSGTSANPILTLTGSADGATVFTIVVTDVKTGTFTFTLSQPIDHVGIDRTGTADVFDLPFTYAVQDKSGPAVIGNFTIQIQDDGPTAVSSPVSLLEDEAQSVFADENPSDEGGANTKQVSGGIGSLFKTSADGIKMVTITGGDFSVVYKDANGFALTETVTWDAGVKGADGSTTFTATSEHYGQLTVGSPPAATLVINADGSYTFTLNAPVAHADGNETGVEEDQRIEIGFTVTDGDGDTASGELGVDVNDDTPKGFVTTASTVLDDEAQAVFAGNNTPADNVANEKVATGSAGSLFRCQGHRR
ncbi:hypothetical protein [Endobacterium cereale]|uniref:hypothetical protein n=1 Tax=Endobacterium cereale TaxID=2663029 RepID=UPI001AD95081|nr:hypothetical protein [Endobacterium cereale]